MNNKELIQIMHDVIDYAMCMKMATKYTCEKEPDLAYAVRLLQEFRKTIQ